MRAAIYCRVSTDNQEREGTSLQTQLENCLTYCQDKGYDVAYRFSEAYSGLSLERPELDKLREIVRTEAIDILVCHSLDRLSRDPVHGVIIIEELEKHHVTLEAVTESVDSSEVGKLITYIRGFASKLEAEKIRERTMRGKKARIMGGRLPTGRGVLYGYGYDKKQDRNIANGYLDVVRMMGMWVLEERISLNEVCRRLMYDAKMPSPKGSLKWSRSTIGRILRNPAYAGKSYAGKTAVVGGKRVVQPRDKWVEVYDAVDRTAFSWDEWEGIQRHLDLNRELSPRNQKLSYELKRYVYCKQCGRKYRGVPIHGKPYYRCNGRSSLISLEKCRSRSINAVWLANTVWAEIAKALKNRDLMLAELRRQQNSGENVSHLEEQLTRATKQLQDYDEVLDRYLRMYGAGLYTYDRLEREVTRVKVYQERAEVEKADLEERLKESHQHRIDDRRIEQVLSLLASNIDNASEQDRQLAYDFLNIKVWIDSDTITIEGILPVMDVVDSVTLHS